MSSWGNPSLKPSVGASHTIGVEPVGIQSVSSSNRMQTLSERIESWFGSVERFENNLVYVSRVGIVDCVTYPFIVYSQQCQLYPYYTVGPSFIAPFRSLIVMNNMVHSQSVAVLWRGWRPHVFLLLIQQFMDALLTKLLGGSRSGISPRHWVQTLIIKSLPHLITMPLLSFKYLEIAQTTKDKATGDIVREMLDRPWFREDRLRRIPFLLLATPTVLHGLLSGALSHLIHKLFERILRSRTSPSNRGSSRSVYTSAIAALWVDYFSLLVTDVLLYPVETVLVRLYCQGMPALMDNIQNGTGVTYVSTYNTGVLDCMSGVWETEGALGFFKGFSSLLIRYSIHGLFLVVLWRTAQALDNRFNSR